LRCINYRTAAYAVSVYSADPSSNVLTFSWANVSSIWRQTTIH